ncbi:MAG: hypothetical protein M3Q68_03115 [Actinomycetota bacterium]|nr:hypothetical protein [Actinomycetota bacterium]
MIVELLTFRPRPDADPADLRARDAGVQTGFAHLQPGLVRRTSATSDDGEWLVVQLWDSTEAADAAGLAAGSDPVMAAFLELVEPSSIVSRRYTDLGG